MATANEVLEQMEQHPELYVSADVCIVDPVTRTISVPDAYRILGVESDESVKVVPFQCPKMVEDDVDLTDFTLYINYVNAGGDFDMYSIENVKESGENITFDWIIRRSVTARRGTIRFILCAKRSDDEGNIIQEWNTTINDECESLEGLEGAPSIADQFPDIIQQILEKLQEIIDGGGGTGGPVDQEQIQQAVNDYLTKNPPSGMTTEQQQQLTKNTNDITDLKSALEQKGLPAGGTTGQVLAKKTNNDYDVEWKDEKTGTGLSAEAIDKLEEVGKYLVYTTADGGSKWMELISILRNSSSGGGSGETVTLQSISATYAGGEVAVGTSLDSLTGITVTAHYSDGSTDTITGYTLSGEIVEGKNTITVSYGGKTTTFTVTGVASGGTESNIAYLPIKYAGSEYWAYFPGVVAGDVYYINYNISQYAVLRVFSPWTTVSASETTWTYEKYNDNYYKITFVTDYGDTGLITNSSWADLEYSTVKYSKNAVPVE